MFIGNLNVLIAVLTATIYLNSWLFNAPPFALREGHGANLVFALGVAAVVVIVVWSKWGLLPTARYNTADWLRRVGLAGMALSNAALIWGITVCMHAGSFSHEEGYWAWISMLYFTGPLAGTCFVASLSLVVLRTTAKAPLWAGPERLAE